MFELPKRHSHASTRAYNGHAKLSTLITTRRPPQFDENAKARTRNGSIYKKRQTPKFITRSHGLSLLFDYRSRKRWKKTPTGAVALVALGPAHQCSVGVLLLGDAP